MVGRRPCVATYRAGLESDGECYTSTKTISGRRYPDPDASRDPNAHAVPDPNVHAVPGTFSNAHVDSSFHTYCHAKSNSNTKSNVDAVGHSNSHTNVNADGYGYTNSYCNADRNRHAEAYA
jgi:hypothetical protein